MTEKELIFSSSGEGRVEPKECCHLTLDLSSVGVHLDNYMGFSNLLERLYS